MTRKSCHFLRKHLLPNILENLGMKAVKKLSHVNVDCDAELRTALYQYPS